MERNFDGEDPNSEKYGFFLSFLKNELSELILFD